MIYILPLLVEYIVIIFVPLLAMLKFPKVAFENIEALSLYIRLLSAICILSLPFIAKSKVHYKKFSIMIVLLIAMGFIYITFIKELSVFTTAVRALGGAMIVLIFIQIFGWYKVSKRG